MIVLIRSRKEIILSWSQCNFGKIGRNASEEVILELIESKYIPVLLYGLEACHLIKAQTLCSLDFVVNRLFMKLCRTNNIEIVKCCKYYLGL